MVSGAPKPGGHHRPEPGGIHMMAPGGTNLNERYQRRLLGGYPDFDMPADGSGARVAQTRSVANVRRGRAAGTETYNWTLPTVPGGSTTAVASIAGGTTATSTYTPDVAGTYVFRCTVTFSDGTVVVKNNTYVSA